MQLFMLGKPWLFWQLFESTKMLSSPDTYKVVLCGCAGVGKTSLLQRFLHNDQAPGQCEATIGVDFSVYVGKVADGRTIRLQFWDTAGAERFKAVQNFVWRDARALVFVYDLTSRDSYVSMEAILGDALTSVGPIDPWVVVVGNKVDLADKRTVSTKEAQSLCQKFNYTLIEASALDGTNVVSMLEKLCETIDQRFGNAPAPTRPKGQSVSLSGSVRLNDVPTPREAATSPRVMVTPRKATCEC